MADVQISQQSVAPQLNQHWWTSAWNATSSAAGWTVRKADELDKTLSDTAAALHADPMHTTHIILNHIEEGTVRGVVGTAGMVADGVKYIIAHPEAQALYGEESIGLSNEDRAAIEKEADDAKAQGRTLGPQLYQGNASEFLPQGAIDGLYRADKATLGLDRPIPNTPQQASAASVGDFIGETAGTAVVTGGAGKALQFGGKLFEVGSTLTAESVSAATTASTVTLETALPVAKAAEAVDSAATMETVANTTRAERSLADSMKIVNNGPSIDINVPKAVDTVKTADAAADATIAAKPIAEAPVVLKPMPIAAKAEPIVDLSPVTKANGTTVYEAATAKTADTAEADSASQAAKPKSDNFNEAARNNSENTAESNVKHTQGSIKFRAKFNSMNKGLESPGVAFADLIDSGNVSLAQRAWRYKKTMKLDIREFETIDASNRLAATEDGRALLDQVRQDWKRQNKSSFLVNSAIRMGNKAAYVWETPSYLLSNPGYAAYATGRKLLGTTVNTIAHPFHAGISVAHTGLSAAGFKGVLGEFGAAARGRAFEGFLVTSALATADKQFNNSRGWNSIEPILEEAKTSIFNYGKVPTVVALQEASQGLKTTADYVGGPASLGLSIASKVTSGIASVVSLTIPDANANTGQTTDTKPNGATSSGIVTPVDSKSHFNASASTVQDSSAAHTMAESVLPLILAFTGFKKGKGAFGTLATTMLGLGAGELAQKMGGEGLKDIEDGIVDDIENYAKTGKLDPNGPISRYGKKAIEIGKDHPIMEAMVGIGLLSTWGDSKSTKLIVAVGLAILGLIAEKMMGLDKTQDFASNAFSKVENGVFGAVKGGLSGIFGKDPSSEPITITNGFDHRRPPFYAHPAPGMMQ